MQEVRNKLAILVAMAMMLVRLGRFLATVRVLGRVPVEETPLTWITATTTLTARGP